MHFVIFKGNNTSGLVSVPNLPAGTNLKYVLDLTSGNDVTANSPFEPFAPNVNQLYQDVASDFSTHTYFGIF